MVKEIRNIGLPFVALFFLYLLNPFGLNIMIGYVLAALMVIHREFLVRNLDTGLLLLFLFSITYAAFFSFEPLAGKQFIVIYMLVPSTFYLMGKYFVEKTSKNYSTLIWMLLLTSIVFSITGILSVVTVLNQLGFTEVDRNLPNYWTGQITPATKMGAYFALIMCIPAVLVPKIKKVNLVVRVLLLLLFVISVVCVLRIGSRTQLGIFLITLLMSLFYIMPRQSLRRNLFMFAMFFGLVFYIGSTVSFDLDQDWLSAFAGRMEDNGSGDLASGGGRTERWVKSMEYLFVKPLGWSEHEFGHAHNLWFDVLRIGGFLSFFLLIGFTTNAFLAARKAIKKNKKAYALNNQILCYTICFALLFTVEPIMEGTFDFFAVFCFFIGAVKKYTTDYPVIG
ncbi:O-antigen ligase family protein [Flagellimonas myxillae]|uniref:O-antigen ligase family protein n=1 Tax=Flagellimonas myxillae TaxID=2942214 RepID=UPI00201F1E48|nr:hypothetical protein [Muricauda myxillae]MCL6266232.1 hypothetical protein [Muricauda myxillae]